MLKIFNSTIETTERYIDGLVENYFLKATEPHEMEKGTRDYTVTMGEQRDSVLEPVLWNVIYNGLFARLVLIEAMIVGFVHDLAITAKRSKNVEVYTTEIVRVVKFWLERAGPALAEKNGTVSLTNRGKTLSKCTIQ